MDILILKEQNPEAFFPLTHTRATFELRYGAWCPLDRAIMEAQKTKRRLVLQCRDELASYLRAKTGLPVNEDIDGEICKGLPASTPWEILENSAALITDDWEEWNQAFATSRRAVPRGVHVIGRRGDIYLASNATVQPGCVLDASDGPIIIAEGAQVKFSQIQGPVFIGAHCRIDGARLRPGTSLGPHCKVGGEMASSIFQSRVNKAHDGFVGHSWAGRWVNFGAMSTTSNLKNTYGKIRYQRDEDTLVETGAQFLGSLIGDHTKIGIGQLLATGSNLGVGCNIYGGSMAPKYIPSFCWMGPDKAAEHHLEKCLDTVRATLARRNAKLRPASAELLRHLFHCTASARAHFIDQHATV